MTWVCAECGSNLVHYGIPVIKGTTRVCSKNQSHLGEMKLEDYEARQERKEVAQQDIADLFGPPDLR